MFNKLINIAFIFIFFNFVTPAYADTDQWQDSDQTYKDLIDEGFEVKAYNINTIPAENGLLLMFFVTVLQKDRDVYECQEYQTLDQNMQTIDLNFVCRKLTQPYTIGIGT